ncbi:MAG: hypothetical protein U1E65_22550 [Myxococcota bacterium]
MGISIGPKPALVQSQTSAPLSAPKHQKLRRIAQATQEALNAPRAALKSDLPFDPRPDGNIWTAFPLHDLSLIRTQGRHGQGFRLDSGSLRGMALFARRVEEAGTPAFEISFEARGTARETYRRRLVDRGASKRTAKFQTCTVENTADGKSKLVEASGGTSVHGEVLVLEQPGRWRVSFVARKPEALRGSMRIRVYGDDKAATEALNDVVIRLGLQSAFAPPAPSATDRLKLLRASWPVNADLRVGYHAIEELLPQIEQAIHRDDVPALTRPPLTAEEAALIDYALSINPRFFLNLLESNSGLPGEVGAFAPALRIGLRGLDLTPEAIDAAAKTELPPGRAEALLRLVTLAHAEPAVADALLSRDVENIKGPQLEAALAKQGIDTSPARLAQLSIEEVYPGFFTVFDPMLAAQAEAAGAAYLYSTIANPESVHAVLTGGQKSSVTRYDEGILISGMSSSADFKTGGARSVFTRLVTRSAIEAARRPGADHHATFNDWSGERPFKLILDRKILARTDWYGFTGDQFGETGKVTAENRGVKIVKAIDQNYSSYNEIMFPIGNDPRFVRAVVTGTEEQRQQLIEHLQAKGLTEIGGRPLEEAVIHAPKLFTLPEDMTPAMLVEDAVYNGGFVGEIRGLAGEAAVATANEYKSAIGIAVRPLVQSTATDVGSTQIDSALRGLLGELFEAKAGDLNELVDAKLATFGDAAKTAIRASLLGSQSSIYSYLDSKFIQMLQKELGLEDTMLAAGLKAKTDAAATGASEEAQKAQASMAMLLAFDAVIADAAPGMAERMRKHFVEHIQTFSYDAQAAARAELTNSKLSPEEVEKRATFSEAILKEARPEAKERAGNAYVNAWLRSASSTVLSTPEATALNSKTVASIMEGTLAAVAPELAEKTMPKAEAAARQALLKSGKELPDDELIAKTSGAIEELARIQAAEFADAEFNDAFRQAIHDWGRPLAEAKRDAVLEGMVEERLPALLSSRVDGAVREIVRTRLQPMVEAVAAELPAPDASVVEELTKRWKQALPAMLSRLQQELSED